jgi:putative oxidoreductase
MKKGARLFTQLVIFLMIIIWVYAAASKIFEFQHFKAEMHSQVLYPFLQTMIIYFLPPAELGVAILLAIDKTRLAGMYCSFALLLLFTVYIALIILHLFKRVPCSCGGILEHMGWTAHLLFNLFLLILTFSTIFIIKRKEFINSQQRA